MAGYSAVAPIYQRKMSMECMAHLFFSFFGKISVYPHTILHKSRRHRGNLSGIVTPLPSFVQYCKRNELLGCAEILPNLTSSKLRIDGDVFFSLGHVIHQVRYH